MGSISPDSSVLGQIKLYIERDIVHSVYEDCLRDVFVMCIYVIFLYEFERL